MAAQPGPTTSGAKPHPRSDKPSAASVDREPSEEATPQGHGLPVGKDDEPKGHPTSDRFKTEQAHHKTENKGS